jgi:tetratricopeptide (TPR) repeat protein
MSDGSSVAAKSLRAESRSNLSIALLALAASITSIANGFAVDDRAVIELNTHVHSLSTWWRLFGEGYWPTSAQAGLYRPLTMLGFTIQWTLGGGSPAVFHVVSILLYVATALLVYRLARRLAGAIASWIAAALFAVHPVHVEAVGNVVGQSELIAAITVLAAALLYTRSLQEAPTSPAQIPPRRLGAIAALYAVGVFTKESAIVLPALLALIHLHLWRQQRADDTLASTRSSLRTELAAMRLTYLVLALVAVVAVGARTVALGDSAVAPNTALDGLTAYGRIATMLSVVPEWLRLFCWPVRLIPVYAPPYIHVAHALDAAAVPGILILCGCIALTVFAARARETHAITLGLEWMAIALLPVSNIVFATGILLAERTLFLPSIGFALVAGVAAEWIADRARSAAWLPVLQLAGGALLAAGLVRSAVHQRVWSDDGHLITSAITAAPDSYMLDAMYGEYAQRNGRAGAAEEWFKRAISLYPQDPSPHISLGELYVQGAHFDAALLSFTVAMRLDPENADARAGMIVCLDHFGRYRDARTLARRGIALGGDEAPSFRRLLAITDSMSMVVPATK